MRLAVLASGTGSILQAMVQEGLDVSLVVVDRPCRATALAAAAGIPCELVERTDFGPTFDRVGYTDQLAATLSRHGIELVAMAGFGTILGPAIFEDLTVLNTHPSLLPAFPGWHAVADALAYGVKVTGCTVHVATALVDAGPILAQEAVPVLPEDTVGTLHERIKAVERRLYPATVKAVMRHEIAA
jgi:phosphoribosylglycinamide formyltransferase-1